ncbi:hypothetical protein NLJ89_g11740 [Agrocybe chaxingu]|uniref:Uncharacterized protein n=1 Tax=Agrocybe chaxingu TaxID=84603 RepID=A0A9W8MRC3_9AGAR|nr:hypothetical protein NLJ89_g11740 [Agrocybe chaxingu]
MSTPTRSFLLPRRSSALRACSICSMLASARFSSSLSLALSSSSYQSPPPSQTSQASRGSQTPQTPPRPLPSPSHTRSYSDTTRPNHVNGPSEPPKPPKSRHAELYSGTFPAMIPIFLLGSAVYLGLELTQLKLAHEKYMEESEREVMALEAEIDVLQDRRAAQPEAASTTTTGSGTGGREEGDPASSPSPRSRWRFW